MSLLVFLIAITLALLTPRSPSVPADSLVDIHPTPTSTLFITISPTRPVVLVPQDDSPWGVAQKVGEHLYRIRVQNDDRMGSPEEILSALNALRARHGAQPLQTDPRLCAYTQERAEYQNSLGQTDAHAGFQDFLDHQDGFHKLGFGRVGENSSYGYVMSGVHLIEFVYMQSPEHNANQLNPAWDRGCVGVAGLATNLIFATSPL